MAIIRVASWNLLAQEYVKEYRYPWTRHTPGCLKWNYRKALIADTLRDESMQMDVVCLQEAQVDLFADLLSSVSSEFHGVIQNVTRNHNVGTALLVRKSCRLAVKRVESRSRALIATLEDKENKNILCLCSVHLDADTSSDPKKREHQQSQRKSQLKSLLKRINFACKLENQKISQMPILLAGDFNILRENELHKSLSEGTLVGSPNAKVLLQDTYLKAEQDEKLPISVFDKSSSREDDGLVSSTREGYLVKTYKGGAILDYIWTSEQVNVLNTLLMHPSSSSMGIEEWPCHDHPSDHIPIGVDIEWK